MMIFVQLTVLLFFAFNISAQQNLPIDKSATPETKALFNNLRTIAKGHTLFGHQHATEYGHGWQGDNDRSDVKSVTGSHPAVIGVDLSRFTGVTPGEAQKVKDDLRKNVADTYNRGGVTTVAWHFSNPVSGGGFYWKDSVSLPAVRYIIPGGDAHEQYKEILKGIAEWAKSVKGSDGRTVPMIFRPYHEFDGDWFWWGRSHSTVDEFKTLWKFTVSYLRDSLNVHTFYLCISHRTTFFFLRKLSSKDILEMNG
jgi:mannan endo-1,4-beta-mannosidase